VDSIICKLVTPEQANFLKTSLPVWFNPHWMQAVAELYNISPKVLVCYKKDNPVAYLPIYEKSFITLKKAYNPTLVYYSPLVFDTQEKKLPNRELLQQYEIIKEIGAFLNKNYKRIVINLNPEQYDTRGFKDSGLSVKPQYTFIRNLSQKVDFFNNEMTTLRNAEKQGYDFNNNFDPDRLLYLLYEMYKRKSHPFNVDKASLLAMINKLYKHNIIEQYNICRQGQIVSSMMIIHDNNSQAYAWITASEPQDMKTGASLMLYWKLFDELSKMYTAFDLCGANVKGPSRLKAAMGAELKLFFQIIK